MSESPIQVRNPATGDLLGAYQPLDPEAIRGRIARARTAQPAWAGLGLDGRRRFVAGMQTWLLDNLDHVAATISACVGKTRLEALATEVMPAVGGGAWYARHARRCLRDRRLPGGSLLYADKRSILQRVPWGVVGIIAPWNYPLGIPMHEIVPALLAGNSVVFKTAPETLPVGLLLEEMAAAAGLPDGVFTNLIAEGPPAGEAMLGADGVDKLFFTGSVPVGKLLMEQAARHLIPVSLELGGKDAAIVRADADLDRAIPGLIWAGLSNAGQSCAGVERVYVQESILEAFLERLRPAVERLRVGPDRDHETDVGALCSDRQAATVQRHVNEALRAGARVAAQASLPAGAGPRFVPPTVLTGVSHEMAVMREETFGPVLGVMPFRDDEEALRLANDSVYGLTASIWSRDLRTARGMARRIRAGAVTLNDHLLTHGFTETPWGGFGDSGFSRGHGDFAFEEVTAARVISEPRFAFLKRNPFWQPYGAAAYRQLAAITRALYGRGLAKRLRNLWRALPLLRRYF